MSAKMNWDRVRQENRILKQGSAWVEAEKANDSPGVKVKVKGAKPIQSGPPMQRCTCGKVVGFAGAHKNRCPLARLAATAHERFKAPDARSMVSLRPIEVTLATFSNSLKKAGLSGLWSEFCRLQLRALAADKSLDLTTRADVVKVLTQFEATLSGSVATKSPSQAYCKLIGTRDE